MTRRVVKAQWSFLIPRDQHQKFLSGERTYCVEEELAFHRAVYAMDKELIEETRDVVLAKREEYLLYYLENELV